MATEGLGTLSRPLVDCYAAFCFFSASSFIPDISLVWLLLNTSEGKRLLDHAICAVYCSDPVIPCKSSKNNADNCHSCRMIGTKKSCFAFSTLRGGTRLSSTR